MSFKQTDGFSEDLYNVLWRVWYVILFLTSPMLEGLLCVKLSCLTIYSPSNITIFQDSFLKWASSLAQILAFLLCTCIRKNLLSIRFVSSTSRQFKPRPLDTHCTQSYVEPWNRKLTRNFGDRPMGACKSWRVCLCDEVAYEPDSVQTW